MTDAERILALLERIAIAQERSAHRLEVLVGLKKPKKAKPRKSAERPRPSPGVQTTELEQMRARKVLERHGLVPPRRKGSM